MLEQPNIVLFLTDDHGAWANGCYGNGEVHTPALDALAAEGRRFEPRIHADAGLFAGARLFVDGQDGVAGWDS